MALGKQNARASCLSKGQAGIQVFIKPTERTQIHFLQIKFLPL